MTRERFKRPDASHYKNPERVCKWCGAPLPKRRRSWCKDQCATEFWARHSWPVLKTYVHKRDRWTCQICGVRYVNDTRLMHADHIVPIADGGAEFEPDNVRTLCLECHKDVTRAWHAERARRRREGIELEAPEPVEVVEKRKPGQTTFF